MLPMIRYVIKKVAELPVILQLTVLAIDLFFDSIKLPLLARQKQHSLDDILGEEVQY